MTEPKIIYENKDFLVVDKPSGLMVHGVKLGDRRRGTGDRKEEETLVDWLLKKYPEIKTVGDDLEQRPGIVHRLDKGTSGIMLVARNQRSFEYLKSLFQKHEVKKTYLAVVAGMLASKEGRIDAPIGILTGSTRRSVHSKKMAKEAVTEYKVIGYRASDLEPKGSNGAARGSTSKIQQPLSRGFSLLEVRPQTGRTHQIRVHLASIGHPIAGDPLYGSKKGSRKGKDSSGVMHSEFGTRLMLHALSIEFVAADGNRMRFEAEPEKPFRGF